MACGEESSRSVYQSRVRPNGSRAGGRTIRSTMGFCNRLQPGILGYAKLFKAVKGKIEYAF